jgi:hypothetical protein
MSVKGAEFARGLELAEVRDAIASSFNADEFDMFLYERLDFDRPAEVKDGPFRQVVGQVLQWFEHRGPVARAALIAEVAAARPLRPDIQALYRRYAQDLLSDTRQRAIDEAVAREYERFGLTPPVVVFQGGGEGISVGGGRLEKIVKPLLQNITGSQWRELWVAREGRVCRVEIEGDRPRFGSGFLVGPDALLTNYHVLKDVIEGHVAPGKVRFRFDYKRLLTQEVSSGVVVGLAPGNWLIDSTPYTAAEWAGTPDATLPTEDELDFALVRLDRPVGTLPIPPAGPGGRPRGWVEVPASDPALYVRMPLLILQHLRAAPLQLDLDTEAVLRVNANGTRVRYAINTEAGSSGAPCFDMDWGLVALHHYGDPGFGQPRYSQGVPIGKIRERLKRAGKGDALGGPSP